MPILLATIQRQMYREGDVALFYMEHLKEDYTWTEKAVEAHPWRWEKAEEIVKRLKAEGEAHFIAPFVFGEAEQKKRAFVKQYVLPEEAYKELERRGLA